LQPAEETLQMIRGLERQLLSRSEHLELLRWAVAHGQVGAALALLTRLL